MTDHDSFPGATVPPEDPRYATLVRGFNQRWVGQPEFVQVCGNAEQVRETVQHCVERSLRITVRGGGHCYENFVSGNDGGVIIDLSPLNRVYRDEETGRYCVEGGCTLWDVYTQLYKNWGVTIPGGSCYSVGAGGHVTGGGYGLLSRLHGLTVDYLWGVEVVVVDEDRRARLVTVTRESDEEEERELLWAHQGAGGGNFGIVTKFWFEDPPPAPPEAWLATMAWDWSDLGRAELGAIVANYGTYLAANSDPASPAAGLFGLLHLTQKDASQVVLTAQYVGDDVRVLDGFLDVMRRDVPEPIGQRVPVGWHYHPGRTTDVRHMPWLEVTQTLDSVGANQRGKYKSAYMLRPFPEGQIDTIWDFLTTDAYSNSQALLQVDSYGGQVNAVAPDATAVPQRSSIMKLQYQTYWTRPSDDDVNLSWMRAFYDAMYGPQGPRPGPIFDGCYVNYPDVDLDGWQYLYYKDLYPRLQKVKRVWDPGDVFNHAQSIELP